MTEYSVKYLPFKKNKKLNSLAMRERARAHTHTHTHTHTQN